jgi:hypothetical protein
MEHAPQPALGAHWTRPERQPAAKGVTHRKELARMTPVFGTAQPLAGLSGLIRRKAYAIPEHLVRHWMLLLIADRVDVLEARVKRVAKGTAAMSLLLTGGWLALRALRA